MIDLSICLLWIKDQSLDIPQRQWQKWVECRLLPMAQAVVQAAFRANVCNLGYSGHSTEL